VKTSVEKIFADKKPDNSIISVYNLTTNYFIEMRCSRCGIESDKYALNGNCPVCGFIGTTGDSSFATGSDIAPWETKTVDYSPLRALVLTFRNSFLSHRRFFSKIAGNPVLMPALFYGMAFGSIGTCAHLFWNNFPSLSLNALFLNSASMDNFRESVSPTNLIATPIVLLVSLFLSAFYIQILLLVTGSGKKSFRFTFKTVCYAGGAMVFELLPVIGPLLSFLSITYLAISGIHIVHEISLRRTLMVLLLPLFLLAFAAAIIGAIALFVSGQLPGTPFDPFSLFK
jgi:hypothetical protein